MTRSAFVVGFFVVERGYTGSMTFQTPSTDQPAPDFSLIGHDDTRYELQSFHGSWLVLYFYPKDNTPGCTTEACSLRDANPALADIHATVVGVSMDTPGEHREFINAYRLPFVLLSDPTGATIRRYGAWGKKMFGQEGILRKTFIIDPEGIVRKVYGRVTPDGHGAQLLADLSKLQSTR